MILVVRKNKDYAYKIINLNSVRTGVKTKFIKPYLERFNDEDRKNNLFI